MPAIGISDGPSSARQARRALRLLCARPSCPPRVPGSRAAWSTATPTWCSVGTRAGGTLRCAGLVLPIEKSPSGRRASPRPVAATKAATDEPLRDQSSRRLRALMAGVVTTVENQVRVSASTPRRSFRLLEIAAAIGRDQPVRIVPTLLAAHALPPDADRDDYVKMVIEQMVPAVAKARLAASVDAFCETIAFTPAEVERIFTAARAHGLPVRLHAEQLSNQKGAALAARYKALSADHLEHLDATGAKAMAAAGTVAVLLPGAFYALQESRKPPVQMLRDAGVPIAIATDCNPGTSPLLNPQLAMNMACTLFGLTPEEALAGMTINAARALGLAHDIGNRGGQAADSARGASRIWT